MDFLLSTSEKDAEKLNVSDRYDRIRLLREREGTQAVILNRTYSKGQKQEITPTIACNGVLNQYKV
jgi:uncharacterized protein (UPF0333 family)